MNKIRERLGRCFSAVFPSLPKEAIPLASPENVPEWDSVEAVSLIAVVEEEFGVHIPLKDLDSLSSFSAIEGYLRGIGGSVE